MMDFSEYLLKVNLTIMAVWMLFRFVFRQLTFFHWNRFYLLGSVALSFILPLIRIPKGSRLLATELSGINWDYVDHLVQKPLAFIPSGSGISYRSLILAIYLSGATILLFLYIYRFLKTWNLTRHAHQVISGRVKVYIHGGKGGSFTFFRGIYLDLHTWNKQLPHVIRHEMAHAGQLHSLDLLLMAVVGVLLWFNPFVILLFRSLRENHEYLADDQARKDPGSLAGYLACLRDETIRRHAPAVSSYFKSSTIKNRIIMLTKKHTNSRKRWLYLAAVPVVAITTVAFQSSMNPAADTSGKIGYVLPGVSETSPSGDIPSQFPLPVQFMERVTWNYNEKAIHPITKKETTHQGLDISAPLGTPVYAAASGRVIKAELMGGWGNLLVIEHSEGYTTFYAHLEGFHIHSGDIVKKGQHVASVGNTGLSTGPHLHYEVRKYETHMNPSDYY